MGYRSRANGGGPATGGAGGRPGAVGFAGGPAFPGAGGMRMDTVPAPMSIAGAAAAAAASVTANPAGSYRGRGSRFAGRRDGSARGGGNIYNRLGSRTPGAAVDENGDVVMAGVPPAGGASRRQLS
ncbi:hypothetical protein HK405_010559 [Cladochytrium tenue]|nr:hypothetical protein HK405_010559 [Cladochytrium tenue]